MKISGSYKFKTEAVKLPSFKICFIGEYKDREEGDTSFSFFIATPDNDIEEIIIENSYTGDFFTPAIKEIYFQNIGSKKTDWAATFVCNWDTSEDEQAGELKRLLGYKVGNSVNSEKPKEYTNIETDPKYLVNTIAQRKFGALEPIGGGSFVGCFPDGWREYEYNSTQTGTPSYTSSITNYIDNELQETGSSSVSFALNGSEYIITGWNISNQIYPTSAYFYFYNNSGLTEESLEPTFSLSKTYSRSWSEDLTIPEGGNIDISFNLSGSGVIHQEISAINSGLVHMETNGNDTEIVFTELSNEFNPVGSFKYKYWLTDTDSFMSTMTATHSYQGSVSALGNSAEGGTDLEGTQTLSNNWECKTYSTFLTRNLGYSFLFENHETATYSDTAIYAPSTMGGTAFNSSYSSNYTTSIYLVSLASGSKEKLYECSVLAESSTLYDMNQYYKRFYIRPLDSWDYYRYPGLSFYGTDNPVTNTSYPFTDSLWWSGTLTYNSPIEEEAMMLFLKAICHRDKSVLWGDYLFYVENDVFDPINTFLTQEYTVDILIFNIRDIENYTRKQVVMKPSKLPEGMESLTITKIMAMQYLE